MQLEEYETSAWLTQPQRSQLTPEGESDLRHALARELITVGVMPDDVSFEWSKEEGGMKLRVSGVKPAFTSAVVPE